MELVLAGLSWEVCLAYLDDVVVFGCTWEEHLQYLRMVLLRLKEAHLKLHPKKCQLFRKRYWLPFLCGVPIFIGVLINAMGCCIENGCLYIHGVLIIGIIR